MHAGVTPDTENCGCWACGFSDNWIVTGEMDEESAALQ